MSAAPAPDTAAAPAVAPPAADIPPAERRLLSVRASGARRRRAGRLFGPAETLIPLDGLAPDDRAAIEADPALIVAVVETD